MIKKFFTVTIEYDMQINSPSTVTTVTDSAELRYNVHDTLRGNVTYSEPIEKLRSYVFAVAAAVGITITTTITAAVTAVVTTAAYKSNFRYAQ